MEATGIEPAQVPPAAPSVTRCRGLPGPAPLPQRQLHDSR
jgi:hypothetical protein